MNVAGKIENHAPIHEKQGLRSTVGFLVVALAVGAVLLLLMFGHNTRILYDPALADLLQARSHLNRSYGPETKVLSQTQRARRELGTAIDLLAAAEQADPAKSAAIEGLRSDLKALEVRQDTGRMTPDELRASYHKLRGEIAGLIKERLP
jgi:hypothetical protein